jgi:hypothetical protein
MKLDKLVEHSAHLPAWPAPIREKLHEHGTSCFEHLSLKVGLVLDEDKRSFCGHTTLPLRRENWLQTPATDLG